MSKNLITLANIFFLFSLIPYFSFFDTPFDLQPWALIVAICFLCFYFQEQLRQRSLNDIWNSIPVSLKIIGIITLYASFVFLIGYMLGRLDFLTGLRGLASYVSIFVFTLTAYWSWEKMNHRIFIMGVVIWFTSGLAQIAWSPEIMSGLVSRFSRSENRGLTAFATEPSFFATISASFLILNDIFFRIKKYSKGIYIALLALLLIFIIVSYAGIGIMLLFLFGGAKLVELLFIKEEKYYKNLALLALIFVVISLGMFYKSPKLHESRGGEILKTIVSTPTKVYTMNPSISYRLSNPLLATWGLVETKGMGFGIGTYEHGYLPSWLEYWHGEPRRWGGKIEGGFVGTVYELGLMGILFSGLCVSILTKSIKKNNDLRAPLILSVMVFFLPFMIFGSLAFPLLGFILGIHLYYINN